MKRPVYVGLSPNLEADDVLLALKTLMFGTANNGRSDVEKWFENYLGEGQEAVTFNSGRSAEWAILKALGIGSGDEVLVQAFTCVAVPNSVRWLGATPIYIDVEKGSFNMDVEDLEKKITKKSRVVMVQHTFGKPADLEAINKVCKKHGLIMVEDCAHALGTAFRGRKVGTLGKAAFFSLGLDKVVSSVFGGVVVSGDKALVRKIREIEQGLPENKGQWVRQQLLHPIITGLLMPVYDLGIGKLGLWLAMGLGIMSKVVYPEERRGEKPDVFPARYANELAVLGLNQLKKLERFNQHRRDIANIYSGGRLEEGNIYLKYSLVSDKADEILKLAKQKGWILGNWYDKVVTPVANLEAVGYVPGSCPRAENIAGKVINLPTYIGLDLSQAKQIWKEVQEWLK